MNIPNIEPFELTKEGVEAEQRQAEKEGNLAWPILPVIQKIPPKEKK